MHYACQLNAEEFAFGGKRSRYEYTEDDKEQERLIKRAKELKVFMNLRTIKLNIIDTTNPIVIEVWS